MLVTARHPHSPCEPATAAPTHEPILQAPERHAEALIRAGIDALQKQQPARAFIQFGNAIHLLTDNADLYALLARSALEQGQPCQASAILDDAWRHAPQHRALNMLRWEAQRHALPTKELHHRILSRLSDITDPDELRQVIGLLQERQTPSATLGVVRYYPAEAEVRGWAIDLHSLDSPVRLDIRLADQRHSAFADTPHPLLSQAGLTHSHGAIRIKVPTRDLPLHIAGNGQTLLGSPLGLSATFAPPPAARRPLPAQPVDVLVPVYLGLKQTLECLESVLSNRQHNRTPHRLIVLDDATPDEQLRKQLRKLASKGHVHYLRNDSNLGFIRSMNRGMTLHPQSDVVWLNADTRVHGNWLDRLKQTAYLAQDIASVTPWSNNGELMSFPTSRVSQPMPDAHEQAELDQLASGLGEPPVEIETGCGFCLYIKRDALDAVGYLDEIHLLRGYGEETDWCLRAQSHGWRHMGATDLFVAHQGGVSFGEEKVLRVAHNNALLKRRYPQAEQRYQAFCKRDPLHAPRQRLQRARLHALAADLRAKRAGGQLEIAREGVSQAPLRLEYRNHAQGSRLCLHAERHGLALRLEYTLPADFETLHKDLAELPLDSLRFHLHANCPTLLHDLPTGLGVDYQIVVDDDSLLEAATPRLTDFANGASSLQLPWHSLLPRYRAALPDARLSVRESLPSNRPAAHAECRTWLIADNLARPEIAERWVRLARRLRRQRCDLTLLLAEETPWADSLLATAIAYRLPEVPGLTRTESLQLAACRIAVSLDDTPGADWRAAELAHSLGLPLYAPASPLASEAGVHPLDLLPLADGLADADL